MVWVASISCRRLWRADGRCPLQAFSGGCQEETSQASSTQRKGRHQVPPGHGSRSANGGKTRFIALLKNTRVRCRDPKYP